MSNKNYKPPSKFRIILWLIAAIFTVYVLIFHSDKSVKSWGFSVGNAANFSYVISNNIN